MGGGEGRDRENEEVNEGEKVEEGGGKQEDGGQKEGEKGEGKYDRSKREGGGEKMRSKR